MNNIFAVELALEDMKFSFSKINAYYTCPKMFYLQYIEKKPSTENAFAQFGTLCHAILEKYAKGKLEMYELLDEYEKEFDQIVIEPFPPNKYVDLREKYFNQGYTYFENFVGFDDYKIIGVEKYVDFTIDDKYPFVGIIDLYIQDENGDITILDHKSKSIFEKRYFCTTCGKNYKNETAKKREFKCTKKCNGDLIENKKEAKEYLRQLYLYAIAVFQESGEYPKKLIFNFFRDNEFYVADFDENEMIEAKKWVVGTIDEIRNDDKFKPNADSFFCNHICGVRHYCTDSDKYLGLE